MKGHVTLCSSEDVVHRQFVVLYVFLDVGLSCRDAKGVVQQLNKNRDGKAVGQT